jgi:hypothetical protein
MTEMQSEAEHLALVDDTELSRLMRHREFTGDPLLRA